MRAASRVPSVSRALPPARVSAAPTQTRALHTLPRLDYNPALGVPPVYSAANAKQHWDQVYRENLRKLNLVLEGTGDENRPIEETIILYRTKSDHAIIFNQAASAYNHKFLFMSICPGGQPMSPWLANCLALHFGSVERFSRLWKQHATSMFGSGWLWLVDYDGALEIVPAFNSGNPVGRRGVSPLLVQDLWEHAYYTDYGIDRGEYTHKWFEAVNWTFVETMLRRVERHPHVNPHPLEGANTFDALAGHETPQPQHSPRDNL